jgi:deoxyribodipyrimidine photo-lyase
LNPEAINIVWLKRDLRLQDHEPLYKAEQGGIPYIIIYIFEPSIIEYKDTSQRHLQFVYHSIKSLHKRLQKYNRKVAVFYGDAIDVFAFLNKIVLS